MQTRKRSPALLLLLTAQTTLAFNGHQLAEGPLRLEIAPVVDVTRYDQPYDVNVTMTNLGATPLAVQLRLAGLVDEWRSVGATAAGLTIPAGSRQGATFQIAAGVGACSALYPVHVYAEFSSGGQDYAAHAVQVIETTFAPAGLPSPDLPVTSVPARGALLLTQVRNFRVGWAYFDQAEVLLPTGWQGQAEPSRASCAIHDVTRGTTRQALNMHPAWWQGQGNVFVDYRLALPATTPIQFSAGQAIRDHTAREPPSDGVTFRVWINDTLAQEHHTDSKSWVDRQVDLSAYAGQEIRLRLECHPGPQRNTTCDSAYWGTPAITVGPAPPQLTAHEADRLRRRAEELVASGHGRAGDEFVLPLADGLRAGVVLGPSGLVDGVIGLGAGNRCVTFDGIAIAIRNHRLGPWPSPLAVTEVDAERLADGRVRVVHRCAMGQQEFDLTTVLSTDSAGLRVKVRCAERITDLASGRFNDHAGRVYYGHGYCIVEPGAFRAGFGGHNLSTSHVGFDFDRGVSLLSACDNPPDFLEVNPDQGVYALHTHMGATLTFVPSLAGIVDCATKYRDLDSRRPSPGFARKAGRFVFDVWGGSFAENARRMRQMVDYGLNDALLTMHVWQRWGYDYRLPDIYPPHPGLGTVDDLRRLGEVCDTAGIPWGLHDNYIDFYPDAEAFSYDHICFSESGQPVKAWINTGRDAQSYRFRPDHIQPFVERNLRLIQPDLHPSHYFIDVFASINPFDFYDRHGRFHSFLETRRHWGEAFRWIQAFLGPGTITTSEAGHDQLVGVLDGADCQQLNLTPDGGRFQIRLPCRDWERFPWFDLVLHDRFSLHGVGYPGRYEGGRSRRDHGIESDDYLSAEVLLGHALMIDRASMPRGAVRKYWLAQDFIRSIATDTIDKVAFAGGDIHRITVAWASGATVHVNRGPDDWPVGGKILPQYGYYASKGDLESSIERVNGVIVEQSRSAGRRYVNARGHHTGHGLFITPQVESATYLGGRRFSLPIHWQARRPAPRDLNIFLHFKSPRAQRDDEIAFQGDYTPVAGSSTWLGDMRTGADRIIDIPEGFGAGRYAVQLGLYDPNTGTRYRLDAVESDSHAYPMGQLIAEGTGGSVTNILFLPDPVTSRPAPRWGIAQSPVDFGPVRTIGAVRCEWSEDRIVLTPLPDEPAFTIALDTMALMRLANPAVSTIRALDNRGRFLHEIAAESSGSTIIFDTDPHAFTFEIPLRQEAYER